MRKMMKFSNIMFFFTTILSLLFVSCKEDKKYYVTVHYLQAKENASKTNDVNSSSKTFAFQTLSNDGKGGSLKSGALDEFQEGSLSTVTINKTDIYGTCGIGRVKEGKKVDYSDISKAVEGDVFELVELSDVDSTTFNFVEDLYVLYSLGNKSYVTVHYLQAKENASKTTDVEDKNMNFPLTKESSSGGKVNEGALDIFEKAPYSGFSIGTGTYGSYGVGRVKQGQTAVYDDADKAKEGDVFSLLEFDDVNDTTFNFGEELYILYTLPITPTP